MKFETKTVHAGQTPDPSTGAITTPIYQTATYVVRIGEDKGYQYARTNNPTRTALEKLLGELEDSSYALAFATGMAAADAVIHAVLKQGDHVVCCDDAYGGVYRIFEQNYKKFGISVSYVDTRYPDRVAKAIKEETRLVWLETPTNPLLKVADLKSISFIIEKVNRSRPNSSKKIVALVDNTFMTPFFLRPLSFGVDLVLHSTTKFLSGHNQLVGGCVVVHGDTSKWYFQEKSVSGKNGKSEVRMVNTLYEDIKFVQNSVGAVPGPQDCFLTILGIKTLALRMERQDANARKIVALLEGHPKVKTVNYPGMASHINHSIARDQMTGFGAMISFELKGGV
ncbi:MAG TPA: aminotransferase class I/II-fold pyridoxal phosphate-dependent enzyme, partial [Candidatus Hodarchaeales archaeon]|nr:aminotransferase class I/II-fold pyridoxal phosphate-dependent enzyme [Candidatus Hodarchaeales archaeon]